MKQVVWAMFFLAPVLVWAQSDGKGVSVEGLRPTEAAKTVVIANPAGAREVSLPQVYDRLGLTAQQHGLWSLFESRVDAYASAYYRQKPVIPAPEDAAPHQIGRMVDNLQNRLAALEDVEAAAKSLYASLTQEQQKTANQMLILAIPTFTSSGNGSNPASAEARRKDNKADGGRRSRRGGAAGGLTGPMSEN